MLAEQIIAQLWNCCEINRTCQDLNEKNISPIGTRFREERERLGLSQDELAAKFGVSRRTQLAWEKGDQFPNAEVLSLAAAAGIDVLYMLTGTRTPQAKTALTDEESALLDNYHHSDDEGRAAARRVLSSLAQHQPKAASGGKR